MPDMEYVFCFGGGGSGGLAPQASYYEKPITLSRQLLGSIDQCLHIALCTYRSAQDLSVCRPADLYL